MIAELEALAAKWEALKSQWQKIEITSSDCNKYFVQGRLHQLGECADELRAIIDKHKKIEPAKPDCFWFAGKPAKAWPIPPEMRGDGLPFAVKRLREYERAADAGEGLLEWIGQGDDIMDIVRAYLAEHAGAKPATEKPRGIYPDHVNEGD